MTFPNGSPRAVALLGAQRFSPTLSAAVAALGVEGPIATITAGWQEREAEDKDLHEHLGQRTVNLRVWERGEQVFREDPELRAAHRKRQERLRFRQDFYRIRIEHELMALHVILNRQAPAEVLKGERDATLQAIREEDERHIEACTKIRAEFSAEHDPLNRDSIARHRRELATLLEDTSAVAIAGGHVAVLLNRLELFGLGELIGNRAVIAWSAGAMVISERVVLFHDSPPQGRGAAEVLEAGLGIVPGILPLPQPESRLLLNDPERVSVLARRFAPAQCLALPTGATLVMKGGSVRQSRGVIHLRADGTAS